MTSIANKKNINLYSKNKYIDINKYLRYWSIVNFFVNLWICIKRFYEDFIQKLRKRILQIWKKNSVMKLKTK